MKIHNQSGFITKTNIVIACLVLLGVWQYMKRDKLEVVGNFTPAQIEEIAQNVGPSDIVIYTTTGCPHSASAKDWMDSHDITYKDCNLTTDQSCVNEFKDFGGDGVPWLVVKGHHMKDGFDKNELLSALQ